ncbi:unnamed protein product [Caenorhabditis brenneri]
MAEKTITFRNESFFFVLAELGFCGCSQSSEYYFLRYSLQWPPTSGQVDVFEGAILEILFNAMNQSIPYQQGILLSYTVKEIGQGSAPI